MIKKDDCVLRSDNVYNRLSFIEEGILRIYVKQQRREVAHGSLQVSRSFYSFVAMMAIVVGLSYWLY
jgi:hypothetical protein